MSFLFELAVLVAACYVILTAYISFRWQHLPETIIPDALSSVSVSVIVPARNEARHIIACLNSILRQQYPSHQFEIVVIDDHSEDDTAVLVKSLTDPRIKLLSAAAGQKGKKHALTLGITQASGELIVTTDADCIVPEQWLASIVSVYVGQQAAFIASPVVFSKGTSGLEHFQELDFLGTMILTGVGIQQAWFYLSNGANLAFPKAVFAELGGYKGVDNLASGDDLLFLHKVVQRYPEKVRFNKSREAIVATEPEKRFRDFFWQRIRWAGKSGAYTDRRLQLLLGLVFSLSFFVLFGPLVAAFWGKALWRSYFAVAGLKILGDYLILETGMRYFGRTDLRRSFPVSQLYHLFYVSIIGPLSLLLKKYPWKGRKVR